MFSQTVHGCEPIVHNAHVVAYHKARLAEWNRFRMVEASPATRDSYDSLIETLMAEYNLERARSRITDRAKLCVSCGDISLYEGLCFHCME